MGNQALILIAGTLILVLVYTSGMMETGNDLTRNSSSSFAQIAAKQINTSAMDMAMRQLADSIKWRATFSNLALFGGTATVTFKDTVVGGDSAVVVRSKASYIAGMDTGFASSRAVVTGKPAPPPTIRAAFTAYNPSQGTLSDMYVDGRNYKTDGTTITAGKGVFAISTVQSSYVNNPKAYFGGTTYQTKPATDLTTAYPEDARTVEVNAYWPNGFPQTPDAALGFPEGTLKSVAQNRTIAGSQYVTRIEDLTYPLKGITYLDVANGYKKTLDFKNNASGIIVWHSPAVNAEIDGLKNADPFKGIIVADKIIHMHMDVLGAVVLLAYDTNLGNCAGNKNHYIRYSSEVLELATRPTLELVNPGVVGGGWKVNLAVKSWYE